MTIYTSVDTLAECYDSVNKAFNTTTPNTWGVAVSQLSGANAANTVTIAAAANVKHHLCNLCVTVSAAATEAVAKTITITDDATPVWVVDVPVSQPIGAKFETQFQAPLTSAAANKAMTITVPALGAGSKSRISVVYYDA